jgi:epoxyqueuosine reductase QueG
MTEFAYLLDPALPAATPQTGLDVARVTAFARQFVAEDPRNALPEREHPRIWDAPLLGIAAASDPLFAGLKTPGVVGPIHRSPEEWLPGAKSVIVWFLPYTKTLRASYPKKSSLPSLAWVSGRRHGEIFNNVLRRAMIRFLEKHGGQAIAPSITAQYHAVNMLPMWSERHAAFIAGIGSFGIHGALITSLGCAGRIGSVITDLELPPTPRPYREIYEYCPYPSLGKCGACIPRCPVHAIGVEFGANWRDNARCVIQGRDVVGDFFREWGYHSCGHCLTWLPCADRIPMKKRLCVQAHSPVPERSY